MSVDLLFPDDPGPARPLRMGSLCVDEEPIRAVFEAPRRIEEYYGCPVPVEHPLDVDRRAGESICIVQSRPVTVVVDDSVQTLAAYDPVAVAMKYVFRRKPLLG